MRGRPTWAWACNSC